MIEAIEFFIDIMKETGIRLKSKEFSILHKYMIIATVIFLLPGTFCLVLILSCFINTVEFLIKDEEV